MTLKRNRQNRLTTEEEPFIPNEEEKKDRKWNPFRRKPTKTKYGSAVESKYIDFGIKFLKVFTSIFTFFGVLGAAVVSKGTLLFMTSQIKNNTTWPYCNAYIDKNKQFMVSLPEEERVLWLWLIIFAFFVPELGTFLRSIRILCFKSWTYPTVPEFIWLFIKESLPTVGSAFLVFIVLPELDVIKGAMLTNAMCFIPGLVSFFSRAQNNCDKDITMILDIIAIVAQGSAFVVWPLVDGRAVLYFIPISLVLISFGWWENFKKENQEFERKTYFVYSILAPWKCLLFLVTTIVIITIREGNSQLLFDRFLDGFTSHDINIIEIIPDNSLIDGIANGSGTVKETSLWTPLSIWFINISTTYICYAFGKFACKIGIQAFSFAFPINLSVPVLLSALIAICGKYNQDVCAFKDIIPSYLFFNAPSLANLNNFIAHQYSWIWLAWLLSQAWITIHIWTKNNEKVAPTENIFFKPMYDAYLIDQSVALNRRRTEKTNEKQGSHDENESSETNDDETTRIYACVTMWHETKEEMIELLKSIFRMDEDQCAHKTTKQCWRKNLTNYYEFETHILFDDAFVRHSNGPTLNEFVWHLIESVDIAASEVHRTIVRLKPPDQYPTPYGGRLVWTLPGKTKLIVHLKDKTKVRCRKRWSQVMYMYYLLGHRIMENEQLEESNRIERLEKITNNTYLLALDGDVDFQPQAVHSLVTIMKKNTKVGAACGRIHPVGTGIMAWYQTFEYAVGHWMQKATEHVIGCVLCSPGCFSLYRANALIDINVMAEYTATSTEPQHFIQYDQGEDRWLCTLLLKRGYRVEYCAASDAYTHCPEGFKEFYNQRRRWIPATIANTLDLLVNYQQVVEENDNISKIYILYLAVLMLGTAIGPGFIFLMLVGAFEVAFGFSKSISFACNIVPILLFVLVCAVCKLHTQLLFAGIISAIYSLLMMGVLIAAIMHIQDQGWLDPASLFFIFVLTNFFIAGLLHPQEINCLLHSALFYLTIPSMYILLTIFAIFNMNNISWGTRELIIQREIRSPIKARKYNIFGNNEHNAGSCEFSFAGLFKVTCCTYENRENEILEDMQESLLELHKKLDYKERNEVINDVPGMDRLRDTPTVVHIEDPQTAQTSRQNSGTEMIDDLKYLNPQYFENSTSTNSDEIQDYGWLDEGILIKAETSILDRKETNFWMEIIDDFLFPIDYSDEKVYIEKALKDLRDKTVITFIMVNSLFVLTMLLLNLHTDRIYLNWPLNSKTSFGYSFNQNEIYAETTYTRLEPIGFLFLICFATIMVIQFLSMLYHRFGTFAHIMADTVIDLGIFDSDKIGSLNEEKILEDDPVQIFRILMALEGINDDEEETDLPAGKRNTIHALALSKQETEIGDLEKAFDMRLKKMRISFKRHSNPKNPNKKHLISKKTFEKITKHREAVQKRISELSSNHNGVSAYVNQIYETIDE